MMHYYGAFQSGFIAPLRYCSPQIELGSLLVAGKEGTSLAGRPYESREAAQCGTDQAGV